MRPLFVIGTRPEAIKLAPVIRECEARGIDFWCYFTGQHEEEVRWLANYFEIARGTFAAQIKASPCQQMARYLCGIERELESSGCDVVVAQGDTFSVSAAAQAAFYSKKPFVHVEAGLRTGLLSKPWPEEYHRRLVSIATELHCAPTERAASFCCDCGDWRKHEEIILCGNTVIDALLLTLDEQDESADAITRIRNEYGQLDQGLVVVTCHRRENIGGGVANVCRAVSQLAREFPRVGFLWASHWNPSVVAEMKEHESWPSNVMIPGSLRYPAMVRLLKSCSFVMSDSGGICEECAYLQKPLIILRDETERGESLDAGCAECVGTNVSKIVEKASQLLTDPFAYSSMQNGKLIYGDGSASRQIVDAIQRRF